MTPTEDRVAELLEDAARLAGNGEAEAAGLLSLEAAALLPDGDPDRHRAFASAGTLLAAAGRHAMAADAWAGAATDAPDHMVRARDLTAEGEAARLAGLWWRAIDAHERALALAEAMHGSSVDTAIIAQNLAMTFKYTGRFDEAERLYRRALAIAEGRGRRQLVAVICHNLGGLGPRPRRPRRWHPVGPALGAGARSARRPRGSGRRPGRPRRPAHRCRAAR